MKCQSGPASAPAAKRYVGLKEQIKKALRFLASSIVLSVIASIEFTTITAWKLPKSDLAFGQAPFQDPFVFTVMLTTALIIGALFWPIAALIAWPTTLKRTTRITALAVLGFILIATPINPGIALSGSVVVGLAALSYCRFSYERQRRTETPANQA